MQTVRKQFTLDNSLQSAVAEQLHDSVVKFDTWHRAVLLAIARHLVNFQHCSHVLLSSCEWLYVFYSALLFGPAACSTIGYHSNS